jgi:hypothetical protein
MLVETTTNLNLEELEKLIIAIVDERLKQQKVRLSSPNQQELQQIFQSIDEHIWKPPASAPSTLEMLQQERQS